MFCAYPFLVYNFASITVLQSLFFLLHLLSFPTIKPEKSVVFMRETSVQIRQLVVLRTWPSLVLVVRFSYNHYCYSHIVNANWRQLLAFIIIVLRIGHFFRFSGNNIAHRNEPDRSTLKNQSWMLIQWWVFYRAVDASRRDFII